MRPSEGALPPRAFGAHPHGLGRDSRPSRVFGGPAGHCCRKPSLCRPGARPSLAGRHLLVRKCGGLLRGPSVLAMGNSYRNAWRFAASPLDTVLPRFPHACGPFSRETTARSDGRSDRGLSMALVRDPSSRFRTMISFARRRAHRPHRWRPTAPAGNARLTKVVERLATAGLRAG
jgi:hypothetical protein